MRTILCAVLAASAAVPASAAGLEKARIDFVTPAITEGLAAIKQAAPRWTSVSMNIRASDPFYDVQDFSLRVNLRGSKSGGYLYFNGNAGNQYLNLSASPLSTQDPRQGYTLYGGMTNISINRSGSSYSISGWVNHKNIWLQAHPQAGGGFDLYGQMGLNLHVMGSGQGNLWVTGSVDLNQYDETYLAAVGAVLTVLKSMPAQ